jgi:type IV pilus assembly protein PilV
MDAKRTDISGNGQKGFSMLEILITLVIIAIAMLGTAGLQLNAMRLNKGSQFRTQAIFMASDLAERMEANRSAAVLGTYEIALTSAVAAAGTDCSAASCNAAALAAWDISQWGQSISNLLPQASWSITQTTPGNPSTYSIVINWIDRSDTKAVSSGGIVDTYTATRTIGE